MQSAALRYDRGPCLPRRPLPGRDRPSRDRALPGLPRRARDQRLRREVHPNADVNERCLLGRPAYRTPRKARETLRQTAMDDRYVHQPGVPVNRERRTRHLAFRRSARQPMQTARRSGCVTGRDGRSRSSRSERAGPASRVRVSNDGAGTEDARAHRWLGCRSDHRPASDRRPERACATATIPPSSCARGNDWRPLPGDGSDGEVHCPI